MVRIKERSGIICEVAVWGQDFPEEGVVTLTQLKASKISELGTTKGSEIKVLYNCIDMNVCL